MLEEIGQLAAQGKYKNPSQVRVDTDKFVVTRGKEQRLQLVLDREEKSINAKLSHSDRGQEGGANEKKNTNLHLESKPIR